MLRKRKDRGDPLSAATERPHLIIIMNDLLKALSQHATQSGMITKLGLSQEWKTDTSMCDRSGQPVVIPQREMRRQQFIIGNDETE